MKVLIFMTQFYQQSGAERLAVEFAEALNARAIEADILSLYRADLPGVAEASETLHQRGIKKIHYLGLEVHPRPHTLLPAIRRLRALIKTEGYDIVESSMITPSIIASWACSGLRTQHIAGLHDIFTRERYNSAKCRLWRLSMRINSGSRFYAISDHAAENWIRYSGTQASRTQTVLNAIPDSCFEEHRDREGVLEEFGLQPDARLVIFVGRLLKRKGIDTLYDALAPLIDADDRIHLFYVGPEDVPERFFDGETNLPDHLKRSIQANGHANRVRFLGRRDDVSRLMASADLLAHPARIEGFGLVLAEALAAGLPVVASRVDGIPEVLAETDSLLIESDDPEACREAVTTVLDWNPETREAAIRRGRERAERFRTARRVQELIDLFEDALRTRV
jgi:glycosyltransferase involved in cell wall biosynthesis